MAALKRNDPCPCGSGKKYKKCCLKKLETKSRFDQAELRAFNELLPRIFDYSKQYDEVLKPAYEAKIASFETLSVPDARAFSQLLFHWMLFNWKGGEKQAILDDYLEEHRDNYTKNFAEFLDNWKGIEPRLFYVVHSDSDYLALKDMWSEKSQTIQKTPVADTIGAEQYVIGYLYHTPDGPALGSDAIELPPKLGEAFQKACKTASVKKQKHFTKHFDQVLQLLAVLIEHGAALKQEKEYEEILEKLDLDSKNSHAAAAVVLRKFLAANEPRITKTEAFAATLEYWAGQTLSHEEPRSQRGLAKKYGVSPSTIAAKYKQLTA
ncbi:SEC-C domain-containing protein [Alkalicoccus daliensis]|uniref:SEC-C motif-containing protein n=1 Tax=Alkalicoccus daliensis TaxID=745820 RepID=A0A1H0EAM3_9BACI|nr:SEC-C domain-containing protein [Alkalicoccus daliensis]SDN79395.1 SEC-C motif-containing protein [Alkalicoccus daliensis]